MQLNDIYEKFIGKVVVVRKRDEFKFAAKMIKITPAGDGIFENQYGTIFVHRLDDIVFIREV
jgi:hypothetical protein